MASIITATTTSGLTQSADNSGVLQLASGVGNLVTVPSVTGTAMVSGNMPAFSAYASGTTSVSNATWTKVTYATEDFDTNNNFASSRFTPTVAGYYQITCSSNLATSASTLVSIYKNGASVAVIGGIGIIAVIDSGAIISKLIYFNGSTDYVEVYVYQNTGTTINSQANQQGSWFTGSLVRTA
jgi:hypothetical protein